MKPYRGISKQQKISRIKITIWNEQVLDILYPLREIPDDKEDVITTTISAEPALEALARAVFDMRFSRLCTKLINEDMDEKKLEELKARGLSRFVSMLIAEKIADKFGIRDEFMREMRTVEKFVRKKEKENKQTTENDEEQPA
jgi:hypothetical protein